jgi:DNA invertase Pin-like site-specific DNA recombinase
MRCQRLGGARFSSWRKDRLGRDVVAVALVERLISRKGARLVSAAGEGTDSDDPTAILMRRIVDAFSEYERLLIGARTKAALRANAPKVCELASRTISAG